MAQKRIDYGDGLPWHAIPREFLDAIPELSPGAIEVYLQLIRHANRDGTCFPSQSRLAGLLGKTVRTVRRAVAELRARGFLETEQRQRTDGGKSTLVYTLKNNPGAPHASPEGRSCPATGETPSPRNRTPDSEKRIGNGRTADINVPCPPDINVPSLTRTNSELERIGVYGNSSLEDLRADFERAHRTGLIENSEAGWLRFRSAWEYAVRVNSADPEKLFRWIVANGAWDRITGLDEQAARQRASDDGGLSAIGSILKGLT
jgi:hypothetical protein